MLRTRSYAADRHVPVRLLQRFLDDELDAVVAREVRRHLDLCAECVSEADVFRAISASIRGLGLAADPVALTRLRVLVDQLSLPGGRGS